jgi:glutamate-ammonia-ligase adenylyltransferase
MPSSADMIPKARRWSRHLDRLCLAQAELVTIAEAGLSTPVAAAELQQWLNNQGPISEDLLKAVLRRFKRHAYARIATRDLVGQATLGEITEAMTLIAELAVRTALDVHMAALVQRYGQPRGADGRAQELIVIGMGKLGGRELNVSSDIDLIFVYPDDGDTDGARSISNFDFFSRVGKGLINAIGDITEGGQVFRVDMRLRPNGDSGPLVCSFEMLENYFISQGREWERYAWIKARPLTGSRHDELEAIRRPFVFRKYLDFGSINAMRDLHVQIRREVAKKDMINNVKLGPGGIREIEFMAQVFQLIRGGREQALQIKPTLQVLQQLVQLGVLPIETVTPLTAAYDFLRRLEHRLQYLDDAQTHHLPERDEDRELIAQAMGFGSFAALLEELDDHRAMVSQHFNAVFADPTAGDHPLAGLWHHAGEEASLQSAVEDYGNIGFARPQAAAERVGNLRNGARYRQLDAGIRERFDALVPPIIAASVASGNPDVTLTRSLDLLEAISRRAAYLALLQQYPQALLKVVQLVSSSSWAAQYLQRHPILLDELLDARLLDPVPDWTAFRTALVEQLDHAEPDTERQMDIMREQHHAQVFRLLAQDIAGQLTVERLADHLSQLADTMLDAAIPAVWRKILTRHCDAPRFAVISYGKLGGKELGYASDLDLVFLYDDESADASKTYGRMGQRLNTWLSAQTPAGQLFDTDLRLRPNGESGLMVSSMAAFRQYQFEAAWPWEHQALTRARFSAGDPAVGAAFEAVRIEVLRLPRELNTLRTDVIEMRQKMLDSHGTKGDEREQVFDIKHDPGGLIDVEFIVQYLILGYAHQHIELTGNLGNIALLRIAGELGLIDAALAERVRNAYRDFRRLQHGLRLNDLRPRVSPDEVAGRIAVVRDLWSRVFELN